MKYTFIILLFIVGACNSNNCNAKNDDEKNFAFSYYPSSKVKAKMAVKDEKKHGLTTVYYENGKVHSTVEYTNGLKDGSEKWFHENGQLYRHLIYKDGKKNGVCKKYYKNGKLMAEFEYKEDKPTKGLKEYTKAGKQKKNKYSIQFTTRNKLAFENKFLLYIQVKPSLRKLKFYTGKLEEGKYLHEGLKFIASDNGVVKREFYIPKGDILMKKLHFVAVGYDKNGNPVVLEKTYNLAESN